jgi:hypothetical protein
MTEKLCKFAAISDNYKVIAENVARACEKSGRDSSGVRIMAVTKTVDVARVNAAIACGIDLIGENRVQEYLSRCDEYDRCERHFIGGLQTNKVRQIVGKVDMVHSVDSLKLAKEIDRCCGLSGISTDVLIEVNIAAEESKHGVLPQCLDELIGQVGELANVRVRGLMTIPPFGDSVRYFDKMKRLYDKYTQFDVLSMGMSGDYEAAVEYGSTIVRLGTALFGSRC